MLQQVIADIEDLIATESGVKFLANYHRHLNWLKSLKPQPKQGWSEEDKNMLQSILDEYKSMPTEKRNWLKSLKERYTWKPSKGQMKALNTCIMQGEISYVGQGTELHSLYNDLQKLTE